MHAGPMPTVRIVELPKMTVVSSTKEGLEPGSKEIHDFIAWAKAKQIFPAPGSQRDFLFRSERRKGYEFIVAVPDGFIAVDGYETQVFPGGLYALGTK